MARPAPAQTLPDEDIDSLLRAAEQRLSQQAAPESTAAPDEAAPESAMAKKKKSSDSSLSSATATTTPKHESADVSVRVPHLKKAKGQQVHRFPSKVLVNVPIH